MATYNNLHRQTQEPKAQYDDLIDDYATPYGTSTRHQTYNVQPAFSPTHRRNSSFPTTPKSATGKLSDDETHDTHPIYPPVSSKEIEVRPSIWSRLLPESMACRLFVTTVLIETAVDLAVEGELLIRLNALTAGSFDDLPSAKKKMPVYLGIFALAHVFQFVMAVDAVYARNTLQFMALIGFNALLLAYSAVQIIEIRETLGSSSQSSEGITNIPIQVLTSIIPVVVSVAEVAYIALGWKIYHEFGWKVYKFLGADRRVKKMYANYQVYVCLIKFDVFFWAGFSIQFIGLVLKEEDWEFYVTCAALPLSLVLLVEGHLAARHENKWMMATFMSGCVAAMVYFVYKLAKMIIYIKSEIFANVWKSLTIFSVIAILLLLATFVLSVIVLRNFGLGLKDALARKDATHQRYASQAPHRRHASTNLNRMSID